MEYVDSLLICNSNMFIPTVLSDVLSHPTRQYIVMSDTQNIKEFFTFLDLNNIIFYDYSVRSKRHIAKEKKRILDFVLGYQINKIVFFHTEFGGMANWLIKKMSKDTPVFFCRIYDSMPMPKEKSILKRWKIFMQQYLYWGIKVDVLYDFRPYPSLPKSFYRSVKAIEITMPVDNKTVSKFVTNKLGLEDIDDVYVLLTGTVVSNKIYTVQQYEYFINNLIVSLGGGNIVSKCHPRFKDLYGEEKKLKQIPSFIPGNVLIDNFKYYIGFESTLLVEAAMAGKTAISLIDWLRPDERIRANFHVFFDNRLQGKGTIHFPKSMDEFKSILSIK